MRPGSALAIAAALPGGDPLAAALAAGETPSPQIVAASGETSGIPLRVAVPCLATIIAGLVIVLIVGAQTSGLEQLNAEKSPEVLSATARELIARLGYTPKPIDSASGFDYDGDFMRYLTQKERPGGKWHESPAGGRSTFSSSDPGVARPACSRSSALAGRRRPYCSSWA